MKTFRCEVCASPLYFENSVCVSCGSSLGYHRERREIVVVDADGRWRDGPAGAGAGWQVCRNLGLSGCTWLTATPGGQCFSCDLTRTRPADADLEGLSQFPVAEAAKRRLVAELDTLGIPIVARTDDPDGGLCFDLLSSVAENVVIGHADGVITIDLAESDDAHRTRVQAELDEPYRTMLGHFRHEIGHYVEATSVTGERLARVRERFGDDTADYAAALQRHYADGPPPDWAENYISTYATMHPYEDFAETFAHMLHISDTVETAVAVGLVDGPVPTADFRRLVVEVWMPLSTALNQINRSMGANDLYPFVIPPPVLDKLELVAQVRGVTPEFARSRGGDRGE